VIPANFPDAYINQHLAILRTSYFNPRFLSAAFSSPAGQSTVLKRNRAGVKAGLNFDDIKSFELPDVERGKQEEFDKRMQAVDAQIELQQRELIKLNSLFSCLQHRAFRGELGTGLKSGIKGAAA
jgi:type I restriction enzyme S subunit